jgi:hypothetical protein
MSGHIVIVTATMTKAQCMKKKEKLYKANLALQEKDA